jgi:hypothetical protein
MINVTKNSFSVKRPIKRNGFDVESFYLIKELHKNDGAWFMGVGVHNSNKKNN